jgi:hypothetical protein
MQMMADRMKSGEAMTADEMKAMNDHMQTMREQMKGMKGMKGSERGPMKGRN